MASYRYIQRPTPPVAQGLGAAFHLQGHRYGDREYVNTLFSFPMEGKPQLFPEFPSHLTDDGAVPFEMPVEMLLSQVSWPVH